MPAEAQRKECEKYALQHSASDSGQYREKVCPEDAIRYKIGKNEIESKTYTQLKEDSESFSNVLKALGEQGNHISVIGMTSYEWLVTYFGTVNSGSVIVPLDVNLPAEDVCDLIARSDSTMLVYDEVRKDVAAIAKERCPQLKYLVSMQQEETDSHAYAFRKLLEEHRGGFDMSLSRISSAQLCLPRERRGRARALCLPIEMWRRTLPAWI